MPLDPPLKIINDGLMYLSMSMITGGIAQHKVLLLIIINHNHNKIYDILGWKFQTFFC